MHEHPTAQNISDQALSAPVLQALDSRLDSMDASLRSRLNQARQQALEHLPQSAAKPRWFAFAAGLSACACAAVFAILTLPGPSTSLDLSEADAALLATLDSNADEYSLPAAQVALGAPSDSDELAIAEELEFYLWYAKQSAGG
jgi:hypothetical protein